MAALQLLKNCGKFFNKQVNPSILNNVDGNSRQLLTTKTHVAAACSVAGNRAEFTFGNLLQTLIYKKSPIECV